MLTTMSAPRPYAGPTSSRVALGSGLTLYFSYETLIGFSVDSFAGSANVVCRNVWGPTTGRHLNAIDGGTAEAKALRVDSARHVAAILAAVESTWRDDDSASALATTARDARAKALRFAREAKARDEVLDADIAAFLAAARAEVSA